MALRLLNGSEVGSNLGGLHHNLTQKQDARANDLTDHTHHTDNGMYPRQVSAVGSQLFPDMLKDDKYGNIRIIILLGIPESMEDDTVLVRLYDDILSIGKKPDVIPKIQKMESYREFLLYIAEENNIFE